MLGLTGRAMRRWAHAAAMIAAGLVLVLTSNVSAEAETRTLKLYHVHLRERTDVTYKRNGRFLNEGLRSANWALRDWRESKPTQMDPQLLDVLWEVHRRSGSRGPIHIIGGYRSPNTNRTLRSRSNGVAETSLHMSGKAIDFFIPDVPLSRVRAVALQVQAGGVGYYPRSGSPFVHIDTGKGRYWPRMNRNELAQIFPNGNTVYLPADGKPLPGYESAVASFNQRRGSGQVLMADAGGRGGRSFLARLFSGGSEAAEDEADAEATPMPRSAPARSAPTRAAPPEAPVQVAAARPAPRPSLPTGVAMPDRNSFDTSGRAPMPSVGIAEQTQVAALERVPVPTWATRAAPAAPDAPVEPLPDAALVAALEPAAQAPSPAAPGQLAYAVPTPSTRPPFEAVLQAGAIPVPISPPAEAAEVAAPAEQVEVAALAAPPTPTSALAAEPLRPSSVLEALEAAAEPAPLAIPVANPGPGAPVESMGEEVRSSLVAALEAEAATLPPAEPSSASPEPAEAAVPSGKSGRVLRQSAPRPTSTPLSVEAIESRIEIASLVTGPERRALERPATRPNGDMLVVDVPVSGVASSFAPSQPVAASDRFSGSAVTFLPVR